jgi:hypothetical protein
MLKGICPRCGETEVYIAERETMTGIGGVWGNRIKLVRRVICKDCGEFATTQGQIDFEKSVSYWDRRFLKVGIFFFAILMIATLVWEILGALGYVEGGW